MSNVFPRHEWFERWATALRNAYGDRASARRRGEGRAVTTQALFARIDRWKERENAKQALDWESIARENLAHLPSGSPAEKAARDERRLSLASDHHLAKEARRASMIAALHEAFAEQSHEGRALQQDIVLMVEGGEMTPSQAEAWAATFGWRGFAFWADPILFDPMKIDAWSLPMVAAWIRWREQDEVRRRWRPYLEASKKWVELDRHTRQYVLEPRREVGYFEVPEETTGTKDELLQALRSGGLRAHGYRSGLSLEIPAMDWEALRLVGFHDEDGVFKVMTPDGENQAYEAVFVRREEVLAAFKPAEPAPEWEAELESKIKAYPGYTQNSAMKEMKQFAREHGINITDEKIKDAWKRLNGIEGKAKRGRPSQRMGER